VFLIFEIPRKVADGVGFEPTRSLHPCRFSRPVPSTTRPPIRNAEIIAVLARKVKQKLYKIKNMPRMLLFPEGFYAINREVMGKYIFIIFLGWALTLRSEEIAILAIQDPVTQPQIAEKPKDFNAWAETFQKRALDEGITEETLKKARKHFIFDPVIIALDRKQPEGMLDFDTYYDARVPPKLKKAKELHQHHREELATIFKKHGVPASVIVALWGMETHFGKLKGKYVILGSLATLAYEGRRSEYFTKELINALKIIQNHKIQHDQLKGSWAGAMGHCQFMPTTYLEHATSGDGTKTPDIWNSLSHVFASMANYLHNIGWKPHEPICVPIELPEEFDATLLSPQIKKSWKEWQELDVTPKGKEKLEETIIGYLQKAPLTDKVYLVFNNYELLLKWNKSNNFALSVGLFAKQLEGS
jgi:membrane-bound lytic murein transglycosylase B